MGANRIRAKPAWLRCSACYGTGYKFTPASSDLSKSKGILGVITNEKCYKCEGKGYKLYTP
jgi:hypothetical protein